MHKLSTPASVNQVNIKTGKTIELYSEMECAQSS